MFILQIQAGADDPPPARLPRHLRPEIFVPCRSVLRSLRYSSFSTLSLSENVSSSSPSHLLSRRLSMRSRHPLHRQDYTQGLGSFYVNVFICIAAMLMSTHISSFGKFLALSANFVCKLEGMAKHMLLWRGGVPNMSKMQQISKKFFFLFHIKN